MIGSVFTKNALSCLVNALKGNDRYLQRTAQKALQSLQKRIESEPEAAAALLGDLLLGTNYIDFDTLTKTKTIEKILALRDRGGQLGLVNILNECLRRPCMPGLEDFKEATARRRYVLSLQGKLFWQHMSRTENLDYYVETRMTPETCPPLAILTEWVDAAYFAVGDRHPDISSDTRDLIKGRLVTHLEQALKTGKEGKEMLQKAIFRVYDRDYKARQRTSIEFDPAVRSVIDQGWEIFASIPSTSSTLQAQGPNTPFTEGLLLLYSLVMFQVYNGDAEAVEILEDLIAFQGSSAENSGRERLEDHYDALIEILLSFAAKPSKFLRRITNTVFEGIVPQVTSKGLQSLVRVLRTKESIEGQQEMFDAADDDANSQDEEDSDASDVDMIDSDVEVVLPSSSSDSNSQNSADGEDSDEDPQEDQEDEELAAFDAKLAAALGTKKITNGVEDNESSTSGASDTDMDDDQMMVLDKKLAEVFRARQQETSKKREKKDAMETILNFKNRVLDLIEIYLKVEYLATQSLELLLPLLYLARKTKTKQLADRACNILNEFCKRCKGVNVPACNDALPGVELLLALHAEAGTGASNAHANAASHASVLVVKSLVNSGVKVGDVVDVYADTQKRMLTDKRCKVQAGLFTDWNNWCVSARERFAE